ncbi:MAG: class I SAM-dependent methyltransferase [Ignavibacteriaceae bacterium]|nr:class I SAM-dependent methyltransferase [Ignavibacteriaceae bacterium]
MEDKKSQVRNIFESIASRYDLLNHLLSFGTDFYWRKKALSLTGINKNSILFNFKNLHLITNKKISSAGDLINCYLGFLLIKAFNPFISSLYFSIN